MALLELEDVRVFYRAIEAVKGITATVEEGEIVALIGSNGAGKTTTLKAISGLIHPRTGRITFAGDRIDRLRSHEIVTKGICQAPEGRKIFPRMSVLENLEMGAYARRDVAAVKEDFGRVFTLFPVLRERV